MPSRKKVKLAFASAVVFLLIAAAAGISISRLTSTLKWIAHTYDVQLALGDINSAMTVAGRTRSGFESTGDENLLGKFDTVANSIPQKLAHLEELISDNPQQRLAIARLRDLELRRLAILREAVKARMLGPREDASQHETSSQMVSLGTDADVVTQEMIENEG